MPPPPWATLVDARSLADAMGARAPLAILDCRHVLADPEAGPKAYEAGHLPGAVHAHVDRDLSSPIGKTTGRHPLPHLDAWIERCSRWGIGPGVQVVAYDDRGGLWASRAWWLLRDYGHREVAVLDGGIQAWEADGFPLTREAAPPTPRVFRGRPGHMPSVTTWEMTTRAPRRIIDARDPARYRGETEPIDPVAGHIRGARNVPTGANLAPDGRFKSPEALREMYAAVLGDLPPREAAAYCGSGITATHDILAMEHAGLPGAALYPGSWSEWIRDPLRPVATGEE